VTFVIRKLNDAETLGQKLKALRLAAPFTLGEMSERCKVRRGYLEALESDQYNALPEPIYSRQYLKVYVQALGGDVEYFLERFDQERGTCDFTDAVRLPVQRTRASQFFVPTRFMKLGLVTVFTIALTSYLGAQMRAITAAPDITISGPVDGLTTNNAMVTVSGQVDDEVSVFVNGSEVLLGQDGSFQTDVALERGLNVITVEGSKRYSRSAKTYRRVILEQPTTFTGTVAASDVP
jgi:transcriptional regulator with XRE-family HTH domain